MYFYAAPYTVADRTGAGGGLAEEGEDIEALELDFDEARAMIADGRIAHATTITCCNGPRGTAASSVHLNARAFSRPAAHADGRR